MTNERVAAAGSSPQDNITRRDGMLPSLSDEQGGITKLWVARCVRKKVSSTKKEREKKR